MTDISQNKSKFKRIGVLTSGGDAPGMNAAIRGVVRACGYYGIESYGIRKGYEGLLAGDMFQMYPRSVSDIIQRGGTILQTARCPEFMTKEGQERGKKMADVFKLDGLVVIGGDGSYRGAQCLSHLGLPVVGIPGTIDNDVGSTDYTIGYDTAMNTVLDAIDKLKDTASSHERCSVVEVMGRDAGYIALNSGIAGGVEVILLPEKQYNLDNDIIQPIIECRNRGKKHFIIVVAEGVGGTIKLADDIASITGVRTTATILGHIQRGGSPTVKDRVVAGMMGVRAVQCFVEEKPDMVIGMRGDKVVAIPIDEALAMKKTLDDDMLLAAEILAI